MNHKKLNSKGPFEMRYLNCYTKLVIITVVDYYYKY